MHKEASLKPRPFKQRYFVAKELQFSIALLIVLALLLGIFLQTISSALISYYGLDTPAMGLLLICGYVGIVVLLAIFFTYRLIGPFKRLEYEMKIIRDGNLAKRLSIRTQDDLHVRNFVGNVNTMLQRFEDATKEYNRLNSTVVTKLEELSNDLSRQHVDCPRVKGEVTALLKQVREFREKW